MDRVRQAALTPPPGLRGGSASFLDESWRLFYEDSPLAKDTDQGDTDDNSKGE